jgi:hypothetical protein
MNKEVVINKESSQMGSNKNVSIVWRTRGGTTKPKSVIAYLYWRGHESASLIIE